MGSTVKPRVEILTVRLPRLRVGIPIVLPPRLGVVILTVCLPPLRVVTSTVHLPPLKAGILIALHLRLRPETLTVHPLRLRGVIQIVPPLPPPLKVGILTVRYLPGQLKVVIPTTRFPLSRPPSSDPKARTVHYRLPMLTRLVTQTASEGKGLCFSRISVDSFAVLIILNEV